jgi:transcriptional regulator with XRE-family HTH domain
MQPDSAASSTGGTSIPARMLEGDFAGWLRAAMESRGMSQRMLAALSGIDHSTVSRLLTGERQPSLGTALALIRVLERPRWWAAPVTVPRNSNHDPGARRRADG